MTDSDKLKMVLKALRLSQRQMAKELNVSQASLSDVIRDIKPTSRKLLNLLTDHYGLNQDWFLNTRGEMFSKPVTNFTTLEGDDKDEIIRLLKEQVFILQQQVEDKQKIIDLLSTTRTENDSN